MPFYLPSEDETRTKAELDLSSAKQLILFCEAGSGGGKFGVNPGFLGATEELH